MQSKSVIVLCFFCLLSGLFLGWLTAPRPEGPFKDTWSSVFVDDLARAKAWEINVEVNQKCDEFFHPPKQTLDQIIKILARCNRLGDIAMGANYEARRVIR